MEAARTIQSILISDLASLTPGFKVESAYLPANEVGGDFFQVLPAADGSLLIVVGDVSGKGLKAAMTVSTIVGALRNERERRPAKVLSNLNLVLQGQIDGFATCCAALIEPDGSVAFANAGNLSPYSNGFELTLDGGLPLGIAADAAWEESHHLLALGDRITFISDGVVEATNEMQELFGFERVKQISNQPPAQIAQAARQFGQQDDISIISVTRIPPSASAVA
jgi:serine phosphatase RsbU (regulator of sigma subunit)